MTARPQALPVDFESIPQDLKDIPRWVLWRNSPRTKPDGTKTWAKVPMTCSGAAASSTDPKTWATYDDVADEVIFGGYDGIGLILGEDVHGIDLDDCRDPATGELTALAQEVLDKVEGYAEVSPSGTGIKLFSKTNLDGSRTKKEADQQGRGRHQVFPAGPATARSDAADPAQGCPGDRRPGRSRPGRARCHRHLGCRHS